MAGFRDRKTDTWAAVSNGGSIPWNTRNNKKSPANAKGNA